MEQIKALWQYLSGFSKWKQEALVVDTTAAVPDGCGLFPRGVEVRKRQEDLLGNVRLQLRQSFFLRRTALHTQASAAWLLELQNWVLENPPHGLEPVFGKDLQLHLEKGRLTRTDQSGTATYEGTVIIDYTKENQNEN